MKTNKKAITKLFLCFALALSIIGAAFSWIANNKTVEAAEAVAMDDKIAISSWGDEEYPGFTWLNVEFTGFSCEYVDWQLESDFSANNGVDPLAYTYINGISAREHYEADEFSLEIFTDTGWIEAYVICVSTDFLSMGEFTLQLKAGFTLVATDGNAYVLENDTAVYGWTDGVFGEVEATEPEEPNDPENTVDITETLTMEDRTSWGAHDGEVYVALLNNGSYFNTSVNGAWYVGNDEIIAANGGLDIMQYILIDGASARDLITVNAEGERLGTSCSCWLSNPAAYPVYVESTEGSGLMIRIAEAFCGTEFTLTLKAGFTITDVEGTVVTLSKDIEFAYNNGAITKTVVEIPEEPEIPTDAVDIIETLTMEDRTSWGAHDGEVYVALLNNGSYFNTSVNGTWYVGNGDIIAANGGLDIMQYILIDGAAARDLITANAEGERLGNSCSCWLSNPAAYPVYVESTEGSGLMIRIAEAFCGTEFTLTLKAGFTITDVEGTVVTLSKDIEFAYSNGAITKTIVSGEVEPDDPDEPEVPVDAVDIIQTVEMEDRAWGAHSDEVYVALLNNGSYFNTSVNGAWYVGNDEIIAANGGLDIMQYILINGNVARDLITANANGERLSTSCSCWLSNPAAYPVYVESSADSGLMIRIAKAYAGTEFTITFKAGFTITDVDGTLVTLSRDVDFSYANGTIVKAIAPLTYTLSFECSEGAVDPITVKDGLAIGELPAVPEKEGFAGIWTIDGVQITSSTVYTYGENKTAVAEYVQKIFTLSFECDVASVDSIQVELGAPISNLPEVPAKASHEGYWTIDGVKVTAETVYTFASNKVAVATYIELVDVSDTLSMEDRTSWGAHEGEIYVAFLNNGSYFNTSVNGCWHASNDDIIAANGGLDIMQYILINGVSAREIITANANGEGLSNSCSCWLSNPAAYPVYVETHVNSGLMIRIAKAFCGTEFTLTLKAGFTIMNVDGQKVYTTKDLHFTYKNNAITRSYVLSFECTEGDVDSVFALADQAMANLPAVPEMEGYIGVWTIDGQNVNEETVYSYGMDKTAVAVYVQKEYTLSFDGTDEPVDDVTVELNQPMVNLPEVPQKDGYIALWEIDGQQVTNETIYRFTEDKVAVARYILIVDILDILMVDDWGSPGDMTDLTYLRIGIERDETGTLQLISAFENVHWNDHAELAEVNFGCDIMEYIFINGESVRALATKNAQDRVYEGITFPFDHGGIYAPVNVQTSGTRFDILVLKAFAEHGEFTLTFKEGFMLASGDEDVVYTLSEDVVFHFTASGFVKYEEFTLTFEGEESRTVYAYDNIGELPQIAQEDGYLVAWTIDGEIISADTIYGYGENKTAVVSRIRLIDIFDSLVADDWGSPSGMTDLTYIRLGIERDSMGTLMLPNAFENLHWNDFYEEKALNNLGCDIMEYIYINGKSVREIVLENEDTRDYLGVTFPFDMGGIYAPITIVTNNNDFFIWVMKDFADQGEFTITFKAGFTLKASAELNAIYTLSEDVTFLYREVDGGFAFGREFIMSFDGVEETKALFNGETIGELPAVPLKAGYTGVWTVYGQEITAETVYSFGKCVTATAKYTPIDYTITINRANGKVEELTFNDLNKEEVLASITLTADDLFYAYSWQEALPEALELADHTFVEVRTEQPASTRIISYSLTVGASFDMNVFVEVVGEIPTVKFVMGEREAIVEGVLVDEALGKYVYTFKGIAAYELAKEFTATVFVGETQIDSVVYSVESYLNKLASGDISDTLKTLIADVIAYAQEAEEYVGEEIGIQCIDGLVASEYKGVTHSDAVFSNGTDNGVTVTRAYVDYDEALNVVVLFKIDNIENVTVTLNGVEVDLVEFEEGSNIYTLSAQAHITNVSVRCIVEIFVGGEKVQTVKYSVKSYLYKIQSDKDDPMSELLKAAYNLSLSAKAYSEGE